MLASEYVKTIFIKNQVVNIGSDDYGQCYFYEWVDSNGNVHQNGCGTYNFEFLEEIYSYFDEKGTHISLYGKDSWDERIDHIKKLRDIRGKDDKELYDHYQYMIDTMDIDDYELYDFKKMYEDFYGRVNQ